jgi:hypothetical protein
VRSQAERDEQTLDIALVVLAVLAWLGVVGVAAVAGAVLDDLVPALRVLPAVAFLGFWPVVVAWRWWASRRPGSGA